MGGPDIKSNQTLQILQAAYQGQYGVLATIAYNIEQLTALVQAAENKRSPLILQFFPSTLKQLPSLVWAAAAARRTASVPISIHIDHAQNEDQIREIVQNLPVDSVMVDMSHYDHAENLSKTKVLTKLCHEKGMAVEAESGRINGGEDGIADTGDLEALLTNPSEVEEFLNTEIDLLAPSIGNIHGDYPPSGPKLDYERLDKIAKQVKERAILALHGTNDFEPAVMQRCIKAGAIKLNINKLILERWKIHLSHNAHKPQTQLMDEGIDILREETERWMDICGCSGRAP